MEDGSPLVLAACARLGASLAADWADAGHFEPIRGLWQHEWAGVSMVLTFALLMVRRNTWLL